MFSQSFLTSQFELSYMSLEDSFAHQLRLHQCIGQIQVLQIAQNQICKEKNPLIAIISSSQQRLKKLYEQKNILVQKITDKEQQNCTKKELKTIFEEQIASISEYLSKIEQQKLGSKLINEGESKIIELGDKLCISSTVSDYLYDFRNTRRKHQSSGLLQQFVNKFYSKTIALQMSNAIKLLQQNYNMVSKQYTNEIYKLQQKQNQNKINLKQTSQQIQINLDCIMKDRINLQIIENDIIDEERIQRINWQDLLVSLQQQVQQMTYCYHKQCQFQVQVQIFQNLFVEYYRQIVQNYLILSDRLSTVQYQQQLSMNALKFLLKESKMKQLCHSQTNDSQCSITAEVSTSKQTFYKPLLKGKGISIFSVYKKNYIGSYNKIELTGRNKKLIKIRYQYRNLQIKRNHIIFTLEGYEKLYYEQIELYRISKVEEINQFICVLCLNNNHIYLEFIIALEKELFCKLFKRMKSSKNK